MNWISCNITPIVYQRKKTLLWFLILKFVQIIIHNKKSEFVSLNASNVQSSCMWKLDVMGKAQRNVVAQKAFEWTSTEQMKMSVPALLLFLWIYNIQLHSTWYYYVAWNSFSQSVGVCTIAWLIFSYWSFDSYVVGVYGFLSSGCFSNRAV